MAVVACANSLDLALLQVLHIDVDAIYCRRQLCASVWRPIAADEPSDSTPL